MERYLRVNLLGPGPRLMKKEFTGPRSHKGCETLAYRNKVEGCGNSVLLNNAIMCHKKANRRSQWPRGIRRRSTAAHLLRSWVRIPPGAWMSLCCECCVLSGRSLCDDLVTRPEESYRLWCVAVCDIETSSMRSQTSINCD